MHSLEAIQQLNTPTEIKKSQALARRLNMADDVCPEHPRYQGKRAPRGNCPSCMRVFEKKIGR